jgi:MarR family transcriptional regulator, lower aerobic nicotinate degradation pathway regulator
MSIDRLLRLPSYLMLQLVKEARRLTTGDLRGPQLAVLACVADIGPVAQKTISDRLRIDASDLVGVVDDLERHGYVARKRDERDRRRYSVEVTSAGRHTLDSRLKVAEQREAELLEQLTDSERADLTALLLKAYLHREDLRVD